MRIPKTLALAFVFVLALPALALAQAKESAAVHVSAAWIRVLPGALPNAGYAVLHNDSDSAVKLVGASSPAYGQVMLHKSSESGGVSRMHMVPSLTIPAHGKVEFAPGGYHLMLMRAVHPVKPGTHVAIQLRFADGSILHAGFLARPANATGISD
jgi:periplasmic copper chaperone A